MLCKKNSNIIYNWIEESYKDFQKEFKERIEIYNKNPGEGEKKILVEKILRDGDELRKCYSERTEITNEKIVLLLAKIFACMVILKSDNNEEEGRV